MTSLNVLSLDGGGMRGLYSATVLKVLGERFANLQRSGPLDIGRGFDLVVGTSTGAILAAGIAAGISIDRIATLYETIGPRIFPRPMPPGKCRSGGATRHASWHGAPVISVDRQATARELECALRDIFGTMTLG